MNMNEKMKRGRGGEEKGREPCGEGWALVLRKPVGAVVAGGVEREGDRGGRGIFEWRGVDMPQAEPQVDQNFFSRPRFTFAHVPDFLSGYFSITPF